MAKTPPSEPLGIGRLVSSAVGLTLRRAPLFLLIAFIPSLAQNLLQFTMVDSSIAMVMSLDGMAAIGGFAAAVLASLVLSLLTMAAITLAAYDCRLGQPARLGFYLWRTLAAAPVLMLLAIVVAAVTLAALLIVGMASAATDGFGGLLLVGPVGLAAGLWLMARYWVVAPAVLVERVGFSGLGRSAELTAGYRWPIVAAVLLFLGVLLLLALALGAATSLVFLVFGNGAVFALDGIGVGFVAFLILQALTTTIQLALLSVFTALLYARLRALKEGLGVEDLVAVFT